MRATHVVVPARPFDLVADSQAVFRELLQAMARPGSTHYIPGDPGSPIPAFQAVAAILRSLVDHEVSLAVVPDPAGERSVADVAATYLAESTGVRLENPEAADYVLLLGPPAPGVVQSLRRGHPAYPDESATVVAFMPLVAAGERTAAISLAGPGVSPGTRLTIPGWGAEAFAALATVNADLPLGIDVILAWPDGQVVCLPRSTRLTAIETA